MHEVGLASAELCALALESLLFGAYTVVFVLSIYVLFFSRFSAGSVRATLKQPLTLVCILLYISICTHWVINVVRAFYAFIYLRHGSPTLFYATLADWTNLLKTMLYVLQAVTGDSVLTYRLYHVYGRNWKICLLPITATTLALICGIEITVQFSRFVPGTNIFTSVVGRWIIGAFTSVLVVNLYSTPLIAFRIWRTHRQIDGKAVGKQTSLVHIMLVIVESALVYTVFSAFTLISYLARSNLQFLGLDMTSPVIGLVFCLIIVRIRMFGRAHQVTTVVGATSSTAQADSRKTGSSSYSGAPRGGAYSSTQTTIASYPMMPIAIKIQRDTEVDRAPAVAIDDKSDGFRQKNNDAEMGYSDGKHEQRML